MKFVTAMFCALLVLAASVLNSVSAQTLSTGAATGKEKGRAPKVLVLQVVSLPNVAARAVVVRSPASPVSHDVVLVTASTTPPDLARAVATVMFSRRTHGLSVAREMRADILPASDKGKLKSNDEKLAERDLGRLRAAPHVNVQGLGRGPAIAITPAQVPIRAR